MRLRINVVLGAFLMLAMAFGFSAGLPSAASAQTGVCQLTFSGEGEPNVTGAFAGEDVDCAEAFAEDFPGCQLIDNDGDGDFDVAQGCPAQLGTGTGGACQITYTDGEIRTVQGNCFPGTAAAPTPTATTAAAPTATTAAAPTATTAAAPTATTAPGVETPEEPEAPEAPEVETPEEPEAPAAPVAELPATGAGTENSAVDGSAMLILGSVAVVLAGGAFAIRRRSI